MDIRQPDCLLLTLYERSGRLVAQGKVRRLDGTVLGAVEGQPLLLRHGVEPFALLRGALEEAVVLRHKHCAIFTNSPALVDFFTPPIRIMQERRERVKVGRGEYVEVPVGGDENQWQTLYLLLAYRKFRVWSVPGKQMKEAQAQWQQCWSR